VPPIISVENLGKCYTIRHNAGGGPGYRRLSEELASALARPFRGLRRQGAGSREQGGKQQGAGSKEHGAWSTEPGAAHT